MLRRHEALGVTNCADRGRSASGFGGARGLVLTARLCPSGVDSARRIVAARRATATTSEPTRTRDRRVPASAAGHGGDALLEEELGKEAARSFVVRHRDGDARCREAPSPLGRSTQLFEHGETAAFARTRPPSCILRGWWWLGERVWARRPGDHPLACAAAGRGRRGAASGGRTSRSATARRAGAERRRHASRSGGSAARSRAVVHLDALPPAAAREEVAQALALRLVRGSTAAHAADARHQRVGRRGGVSFSRPAPRARRASTAGDDRALLTYSSTGVG